MYPAPVSTAKAVLRQTQIEMSGSKAGTKALLRRGHADCRQQKAVTGVEISDGLFTKWA
jgi:hypothetical protein